MKTCTRCKQEKESRLFAKRSSSSDGFASWCKACFAEHAKTRYQEGDRVRKEKNRAATLDRNRAALLDFLKLNPCVDCGEVDPIVLTFDHKDPSTKVRNISEMLQWGWKTIQSEIDKCDVRCANCHMRRTANQFGFWKTK